MTEPHVLQIVCPVHGVIRVRTLDGRAHTDQDFCTWIVSFGDVCGQPLHHQVRPTGDITTTV